MRAIPILLAALMLGSVGGYAWSVLASSPPARAAPPKPKMIAIPPSPQELPEEADKQWTAEADDNAAQKVPAEAPANAAETE